ncbi:glycosyltransferase family 4 protein [Jiella marina]|uniref:glycosyltransferase family 4 protein n=1 Tax=Jiella sp. LLJ827 TaxID=2917712 RepID=UPI00210122B4|nr:glycosyltransferase family 4 protein [Jiella sp. LLJ827]MCQ0987655.1 glycosyltransferase family 4 protein [Jiella sp. LLJ827]
MSARRETAPVTDDEQGSGRLRVLFVTRKWPPAVGGMEIYCRELLRALKSHADVEAIALPGRADGRPPSPFGLLGFGLSAGLSILLKRRRVDVVHGGDLSVWPLVVMARISQKSPRLVLSAHGTDIAFAFRLGIAASLYRSYLRLGATCLGKNAIVLANSRATAALCRDGGFRQIATIPLATRSEEDQTSADGTTPAAEPISGRYILFVGRLIERKGCAWFIQDVLPKLAPDMQLVVAGTVWDEREGDALDDPRVTFLGAVHGQALAQLRAEAIAVVMPNLDRGIESFEGFGLTAPEAAAAGAVVLASAVDGITDAVVDGVSGFLLPAGDHQAWASKIAEIAGWSETTRANFTRKARAAVAAHYSWARVAEATLGCYRAHGNGKAEPAASAMSGTAESRP